MDVNDTREVRNENFDLNLKHGLCSSFTEQEFCDMTFAVGNHLYNAHKIILSISSLYLKNVLLASPTKYPIVVLSDVRPKILEYLLQFMYCGSVEVPEHDIDDFLSSGKNLHIKGLQTINLEDVKLAAKDNKNAPSEDDIEEVPSASTITFCPDSIKSFKPSSNFKRKSTSNTVNHTPSKKTKKRHSVSFKIEPDFIKDNDDDLFHYENIMEPEVRIQDDFINDKCYNDILVKGPDGTQASYHAGNVESADTKFVKGVSGKLHLVCNNYTFHKNTMRKDRVYWLCSAYQSPLQCRARCVTIEGKVVSITGYHNHETEYKERLSISSDNNTSLLENSAMVENLSFSSENSIIFPEKKNYVNNMHTNNAAITNNEHNASEIRDIRTVEKYSSINPSITENAASTVEKDSTINENDSCIIGNDDTSIDNVSSIQSSFNLVNSPCENILSLGNVNHDYGFSSAKD